MLIIFQLITYIAVEDLISQASVRKNVIIGTWKLVAII